MKMLRNLAVIAFTCSFFTVSAQDTDQVKKKGPADTYARSSISYLLLDFSSENYSSMLRNAINSTNMPSKFDKNDINKKVIAAPYYRVESFPDLKGNAKQVKASMIAEKYPIEIVKYWWKIKSDGSYSTDLLKARGEYNATDDDFNAAMATKVGRAKIGDQGIKLIGNSYVLVLDYHNIKTMDQIYDAQDEAARKSAEKNKTEFKPVKRLKNGFKGKITTYLFQMNYPDTVQGYFDESFIDDKNIDLSKLDKIFDNVYTPLKLISTNEASAEGTQSNPGEFLAPAVQKSQEELMVVLVNDGISNSLNVIEKRIEAFRVKTPVTNLSPIRAKIGKKESLTHERRYFVWEYVSSGEQIKAKKKGVIRAKKVIDNRNDELGNTRESSFYQIGGRKITEGMTLQEAKDLGIGLGAGYGSDGFIARLDINIGQWIDLPMKQWKLYCDFGMNKSALDIEDNILADTALSSFSLAEDFSSTKISVGLIKEFQLMRNFHFGIYAGWNFENIQWDKKPDFKEKLSTSGIQGGLRLGMNVFSPSLQLIGAVNYNGSGEVTRTYTLEGAEETTEIAGDNWTDLFSNKQPLSFNVSLRLNF